MNLTSEYSPVSALFFARCARLAYFAPGPLASSAAELGLTDVRFFSSPMTDTQAFVARCGVNLVVAFRGTSSPRDWMTDLDCNRISLGDGIGVHDGFHRAFESLLVAITTDLRMRCGVTPRAQVWITGHSLGGALAILLGHTLPDLSFSVGGVYTFGQPRVGNAGFAAHYTARLGGRTWRIVNAEDPVPRVPGVLMGYRHAGEEVFFDEFGQRLTDASLWWKIASDAYGVWRDWSAHRLALLPDHDIDQYVTLATRDSKA